MAQSSAKTPRKGAKVTWGSSQGKVTGTVERIVTTPVKIKGYTAKASPEHPEVLVKSDKTGAEAVHKASELKPARATRKRSAK
jgi:hypothetical protein